MPRGIYEHSRGYKRKPHSEEARRKISESNKGHIPWNKGIPMSKETKKKDSEAHKGYRLSEETKNKISKTLKGRTSSEEHKRKMSKIMRGNKNGTGNKGKYHTEETKRKISAANKGNYHSDETKRKIREALMGEKNHLWRGGVSFEPYTTDWTKTLRRAVRERDHYTCQLCGELQSDRAFDVHHINYNKKNCDPDNLITLCHKCHMKTSFNREYWIEYFTKEVV